MTVFVFAVGVALASLPHRSGYPLADAVEYLRNAGRVESGMPMIQDSVRPFFFSAFLVPIFRFARVFGSTDGREVVAIATAVMIALAGLTAVMTYRLTVRIAGAPAALGAALFLGANRVFQFWSPTVTTDVPCALCVAISAAIAMRPPSPRNAILTGVFLGIAALFKYQALLPGGLLLLCLPFLWWRDCQGKTMRYLGLVLLGVFAGLMVQAFLDWFGGRGFGATFYLYIRDNFVFVYMGRAIPLLEKIFGQEEFEAWWVATFGWKYQVAVRQQTNAVNPQLMLAQPYGYYWKNIAQLLTSFEVGLFALGTVALAWKRPRGWWVPLVVLAGSLVVLNVKAAKDFRLWISIAPFLFLVIGNGFATAIGFVATRFPWVATALAVAALVPNLVSILGGIPFQTRIARIPRARPILAYDARTPILTTQGDESVVKLKGWRPWQLIPECKNAADLGGYERAARWLNQNAPAGSRVSASWFWQFHFRLRPDLFLVEPNYQLDNYRNLDEPRRAQVRAYLLSLDYFATHLQALILSPELFDLTEREFERVATLENPIYDETLNTVYVLRRRARPDDRGWWVDVRQGLDADAAAAAMPPDGRLLFVNDGVDPVLEILDCTFDTGELAAGHMCAILTWRVPEGTVSTGRDLTMQFEVRNARGQVVEMPAVYSVGYGRVGQDLWKPGLVVVQRVPVRPARELFDFTTPSSPNEAVSLSLWLQLVQTTPKGNKFPLPHMTRFSRWRDPGRNDVRVGGIDFAR